MHGWQIKSTNKEQEDAVQEQRRERECNENDRMRRLNKDLSKDITNYGGIAKSISNIEESIKELNNVLQEATKDIVNVKTG